MTNPSNFDASDVLDTLRRQSLTAMAANRVLAQRLRAIRVRTGRLPLPRRVLEVSVSRDRAPDVVNEFVDRLAESSLDVWLDVGRSVMSDHASIAIRSSAWNALNAAIARHEMGVAAWYVRDAVETAAFVSSAPRRRWCSTQRREFAAAYGTAEEAALALLARGAFGSRDFSALVLPWRAVVPAFIADTGR